MDRKELIALIADEVGIPAVQASLTLRVIVNAVQKAVAEGDKVVLVGFGAFVVAQRGGRMGRNPKTGEQIMIGPKRYPKFIPGRRFKALVSDA